MEQMTPQQFLAAIGPSAWREVADGIGTTPNYLRLVRTGHRQLGPLFAARMERFTKGKVPRQLSRPEDWAEIWEELAAKLIGGAQIGNVGTQSNVDSCIN